MSVTFCHGVSATLFDAASLLYSKVLPNPYSDRSMRSMGPVFSLALREDPSLAAASQATIVLELEDREPSSHRQAPSAETSTYLRCVVSGYFHGYLNRKKRSQPRVS